LLNWLSDLKKQAFKVFIVHGENQPADELRLKNYRALHFDFVILF
jgi:metallo-beta-lactamase family protein